ncbi:MAG: hypothetical protein ABIS27_06480, partial [Longimicrobiales bacterium]
TLIPPPMLSSRAVITATIIGTVLQLAMVISGHSMPAVAEQFAVGGMSISAIAGLIYAKLAAPQTTGGAAVGGLVAGGVSALIGIALSCYLGDVEPMILAMGTGSSAVAGLIGGVLGRFIFGASPAAA